METISQTADVGTKKKIPVLVRVIALLYAITAVLGVCFVILMVSSGAKLPFVGFLGAFLIVPALITTIVSFLLSRGLYRGKNWARKVIIFFGCLGFINTISHFKTILQPLTLFIFVLNIAITCYFLFNKKVKEAFTNN